jgi:hypothetical protein
MSILQKFPCRVCGFECQTDVWGEDENTRFSYDICECCACEAGVNDFSLEVVRSFREKWTAEGCYGSSQMQGRKIVTWTNNFQKYQNGGHDS